MDRWGEDIVFPVYTYSAASIFENKIYLFDVNFISPNSYTTEEKDTVVEKTLGQVTTTNLDLIIGEKKDISLTNYDGQIYKVKAQNKADLKGQKIPIGNEDLVEIEEEEFPSLEYILKNYFQGEDKKPHLFIKPNTESIKIGSKDFYYTDHLYVWMDEGELCCYLGRVYYNDDAEKTICNNEVYFNNDGTNYACYEVGINSGDLAKITVVEKEKNGFTTKEKNIDSIAKKLKGAISNWYVILRNIAIIGLLSVLVFIGIKMLMTSIASEKAKYKQMFFDWVIALLLVFTMQYIMAFSNIIVEKITTIFNGTGGELRFVTPYVDEDKKIYEFFNGEGIEMQEVTENTEDVTLEDMGKDGKVYYYEDNRN